jgi:membrane protease YdiL (CAAX protease family)
MISPRWGRTEAAAGAVIAVLLIALAPGLPTWAGYILLWMPLLAAVFVANRRRSVGDDSGIRLRITWMDVLVGAFVGLLLRMAVMIIELFGVGHLTSSASFFEVDHNLLWVATAIVAPVLIAPVVEELFFRGLVLPAIGMNWIGIVASAVIFSAVHLVTAFHPLTALSTFVVGLAFGLLAVRTRRLGASITAHIVYNASLIALSESGALASVAS